MYYLLTGVQFNPPMYVGGTEESTPQCVDPVPFYAYIPSFDLDLDRGFVIYRRALRLPPNTVGMP